MQSVKKNYTVFWNCGWHHSNFFHFLYTIFVLCLSKCGFNNGTQWVCLPLIRKWALKLEKINISFVLFSSYFLLTKMCVSKVNLNGVFMFEKNCCLPEPPQRVKKEHDESKRREWTIGYETTWVNVCSWAKLFPSAGLRWGGRLY